MLVGVNGNGFDTTQDYSGNGLHGMKKRVGMMKGQLDLKSDANGTDVQVIIPK